MIERRKKDIGLTAGRVGSTFNFIHMKPMTGTLSFIGELYPLYRHRLEELYEQDPAFRATCLDYAHCLQTIRQMKKECKDKLNTIAEFESACKNLESELGQFFEEDKIC